MGKTGKKTKSDRINALRKQYDAFLEEDKKRKDRNEFILGHLEKLRMCSAVVPVHYMENSHVSKYYCGTQQRPESFTKRARSDDVQLSRSHGINTVSNCVTYDDKSILKEISEKYILIPKLQPTKDNRVSYNPPRASDDADWKNKYNILDELKKIEKESPSETAFTLDKLHDNLTINDKNDKHDCDEENITKESINNLQKNSDTVSESPINKTDYKGIPPNNFDNNIDSKISKECNENLIPMKLIKNENDNKVILPTQKSISDSNKTDEKLYSNNNVSIDENENENKNDDIINYKCQDTEQISINKSIRSDIMPQKQIENGKNVKNEPVNENDKHELSNINNIVANNNTVASIKENVDINLKNDEILSDHVDITDSVNYVPTVSVDKSETIPDNNQHEPNNETTVIISDNITSQIDEFETEQKEMFYSQEADYNQSNVDTQEYEGQNDQYANEQYSYYNESQQEQPYFAEVNEHEESTEHYDPNYEQQYINNYQEDVNVALYDNQQYGADNYEQEPINIEYINSENTDNVEPEQTGIEKVNTYESPESENGNYKTQGSELLEVEHSTINSADQNTYENQQDLVQMHTEQETIQNLEKQLDGEEGYMEIQNTFINEPSAEIENISEIPSEIQQPDMKVT